MAGKQVAYYELGKNVKTDLYIGNGLYYADWNRLQHFSQWAKVGEMGQRRQHTHMTGMTMHIT